MALSVASNIASLGAQRAINKTSTALTTNFARLSSGLRVNSAADDAAGLAISERLKSQIRSLAQAERNALDGVSLLQTAEGAMNEIAGILGRMREIAVQSTNGTLTSTDRTFINTEFSQLESEIDRIAEVTKYNGVSLMDTAQSVTLQVGIDNTANDRITVSLASLHASNLGLGTGTNLDDMTLTTLANAQSALAVIDAAINDVSTRRSVVGAAQNRLQITVTNLGSAREAFTGANSRIRDVDVAHETAELTRNSLLMQAGTAILAQANQVPSIALSLL